MNTNAWETWGNVRLLDARQQTSDTKLRGFAIQPCQYFQI